MEFLEAGKKRLVGDRAREPSSDEVKVLRNQAAQFKEALAETLSPFLLSVVAIAPGFLIASQFQGALLRLLVGTAISGLLYLLISYCVNRAWLSATLELAGQSVVVGRK